jgi:hypothetical protein
MHQLNGVATRAHQLCEHFLDLFWTIMIYFLSIVFFPSGRRYVSWEPSGSRVGARATCGPVQFLHIPHKFRRELAAGAIQ